MIIFHRQIRERECAGHHADAAVRAGVNRVVIDVLRRHETRVHVGWIDDDRRIASNVPCKIVVHILSVTNFGRGGRLPLDKFVSETIALGEVEEAFTKMERGEVLRSVMVF